MRRIVGGVMMLLALLAVTLGLVMAVVLGTDDRAVTGPHAVDNDGAPVVTAPEVLSWVGPRVTVVAEVPDQKPVFVGLASTVDVRDYLADTEHLVVDGYEVPWEITTSHRGGRSNLPASPVALEWWMADASGLGGAEVSFRLPDESVSLAVLPVGAGNLSGLEVTTAYDVRGGFLIGLGLVAAGFGAGILGWMLVRRRPLLRARGSMAPAAALTTEPAGATVAGEWDDGWDGASDPAEPDEGATDPGVGGEQEPVVEEVVYVYVDEHGVEHEISAEEAQHYEVVEETEVAAEHASHDETRGDR